MSYDARDVQCPHCDETTTVDIDGMPEYPNYGWEREARCSHCGESFRFNILVQVEVRPAE